MKTEVQAPRDGVRYSTGLEQGDYVPLFVIEHGKRKLDIQVKAGSPLLICGLNPGLDEASLRGCLDTPMPLPTYYLTRHRTTLADERLFHDPHVFQLFMCDDSPVGLFLCDSNLKILQLALGSNLADLVARMTAAGRPMDRWMPAPILIVPDVIRPPLAAALIRYFDDHQDQAFVNTGDYKSRTHLHPSRELSLALDDKLSKSLLPEIQKVFYSSITHRETYKICCYDSLASGTFGKHRDTIDPFLYRRYAMTLVLNDDFMDGGISFPEYSDQVIRAPRFSAVIFPGSLYHQVKKISGGRRYVVISFLFSEDEAAGKSDAEQYRFQIQRDLRNIRQHIIRPLGQSRKKETD